MNDNEVLCPHCGEVSNIGGLIGPNTNNCPRCGKTILKGDTMKTFQIEFKRTSYITIEVEAESQDDAEALAWEDIKEDYYMEDGGWEIESIEEFELATDDSRSYGPHFSKVAP